MPKTHNIKMGNYNIETKFRNVFRKVYPYFVGNVVKFKMRIEVDKNGLDGSKFYIKEIFNGEERLLETFDKSIVGKGWIHIEANPIDVEGDVRYRIGFSPNSSDPKTMVSARAKNTDRWLDVAVGAIITLVIAVIAAVVAWILGHLQIIW